MDKVFIFDFDGVLADSEVVLFEALNYALEKLREEPISLEDFQTYSKVELLNRRKAHKLKLVILVAIAKGFMKKNIHRIKPNQDVLKLIKTCSHDCYIVSSNTASNIKKVIDTDQMFFKGIKGNIGLYSKHRVLKNYPKHSIYLTDEVRDIEACHKVGMKVYGCTWGVDSKEKLLAAKPSGIIESLEDLASLLN